MDTLAVTFMESNELWVRLVRAVIIICSVLAAVAYAYLYSTRYVARSGANLRPLMLGSAVVFTGIAVNNIYRLEQVPAPGVYIILVGLLLVGVGLRALVRVRGR